MSIKSKKKCKNGSDLKSFDKFVLKVHNICVSLLFLLRHLTHEVTAHNIHGTIQNKYSKSSASSCYCQMNYGHNYTHMYSRFLSFSQKPFHPITRPYSTVLMHTISWFPTASTKICTQIQRTCKFFCYKLPKTLKSLKELKTENNSFYTILKSGVGL